jgi:Flp pilus assembly protein TadD
LASRAQALLEIGRHEEAVALARQAVTADPDLGYAHALIAYARMSQAHQDPQNRDFVTEAHASALRAVASTPGSWWANGLLSRIRNLMGPEHDAITPAHHAVSLAPEHFWPHDTLAWAHAQRGELDDALAAARRAVELGPERFEAHRTLGTIHLRREECPAAETAYREALRLQPDDPLALNDLYVSVKRQGRLEEAITLLESAVRANPGYQRVLLNVWREAHSEGNRHLSRASHEMIADLRAAIASESGSKGDPDHVSASEENTAG